VQAGIPGFYSDGKRRLCFVNERLSLEVTQPIGKPCKDAMKGMLKDTDPSTTDADPMRCFTITLIV